MNVNECVGDLRQSKRVPWCVRGFWYSGYRSFHQPLVSETDGHFLSLFRKQRSYDLRGLFGLKCRTGLVEVDCVLISVLVVEH